MSSSDYVAKLRRMVAEPTTATYSNEELASYIEDHAVMDGSGYDPSNSLWTETYDLNAAAAEIWTEKAAALSADAYDVNADGASISRNQQLKNALEMAAKYRRSSKAVSRPTIKSPAETGADWPSDAAV